MISKLAVAAGLLGSTLAQSTVYIDMYASTTTITVDCPNVCTTNAVVQAETLYVDGGVTRTIGTSAAAPTGAAADASTGSTDAGAAADASTGSTDAGAAAAAAAGSEDASSNTNCGFQLAVNGTTLQQISDGQVQLQLGQISDGQVQAGSGLTASSFTLSGDMVYDQAGRVCYISGDNQAQFQCNTVPTTGSTSSGFSLVDSNLAFNSNTQFYACLLGGSSDGYNIYASLTGAQSNCSPITLTTVGATDCVYTGTPLVQSAQPSADTATTVATVATIATAATSAPDLPAQTATPSTAIFTGAASSLSSTSVYGVIVAAAISYLFI